MKLYPAGSRPSTRANAEYFTGTVWQDPLVEAEAPARVRALLVTFAPGARTNWHTHPLGQSLVIVSGRGRYQTWGEPVRELCQGDVVWIPPGEKHWHGAGIETQMAHIAIQEALDGVSVTWLEPVDDRDFSSPIGKG
ncbi:MAG: cupin domain-containing protein [Rhizobiales bacterium]|nr:cupin domain-containing protein [Hyphomicrobiales bacterium]